ncbi:MAG: hypothetical protein KJ063_10740 [Anaerolineae bacterium]|nr:hypothetical protein [Anaerolineae bacterium]
MPELLRFLLIALFSGWTFMAFLVAIGLLLPRFTDVSAQVLRTMPGRSFLLGLVNGLFLGLIAVVLFQIGQRIGGFFGGMFGLTGLIILLGLLGLSALSLAGMAWLMHQRLYGDAAATLPTLLCTTLILISAGFAPIAGWFILTPLALILGLGATLIALVQQVRGRQQEK